jgi:hypothetical protein
MPDAEVSRVFRTFNAWSEPFRDESSAYAAAPTQEEPA